MPESPDLIEWSDVPLVDRLHLYVLSLYPPTMWVYHEMRERIDDGRFESVEEFRETKRQLT